MTLSDKPAPQDTLQLNLIARPDLNRRNGALCVACRMRYHCSATVPHCCCCNAHYSARTLSAPHTDIQCDWQTLQVTFPPFRLSPLRLSIQCFSFGTRVPELYYLNSLERHARLAWACRCTHERRGKENPSAFLDIPFEGRAKESILYWITLSLSSTVHSHVWMFRLGHLEVSMCCLF